MTVITCIVKFLGSFGKMAIQFWYLLFLLVKNSIKIICLTIVVKVIDSKDIQQKYYLVSHKKILTGTWLIIQYRGT